MDDVPRSLFAQIASFENLWRAFHKAARGKRARPDVATFEYHLEGWVLRLRQQLLSKTYTPAPYRRFTFADPKPRAISAAPFRDRVVHHALCNIIEPICERRFIGDSYANRQGKGIHAALDRCTYFARRYRYVLRCDIVQFFHSIDLAILRRILARTIRDDDVLWLCNQILTGGAHELTDQYSLIIYPGDDLFSAAARPRGLPIGNQTSQFWANCYLNPLDQFVKSELGCPAYLRYVDDFVLFSDDKAQLHAWKQQISTFLANHLRLILHERESSVSPVTTGIPFLGFTIYPTHRALRRRNGVAFARRLHTLSIAAKGGRLDFPTFTSRVRGWIAHAGHGDTWGLRRVLLSGRRRKDARIAHLQ
jgi:RNA-directed DNA polymerase